jgi:hypothetical protein
MIVQNTTTMTVMVIENPIVISCMVILKTSLNTVKHLMDNLVHQWQ